MSAGRSSHPPHDDSQHTKGPSEPVDWERLFFGEGNQTQSATLELPGAQRLLELVAEGAAVQPDARREFSNFIFYTREDLTGHVCYMRENPRFRDPGYSIDLKVDEHGAARDGSPVATLAFSQRTPDAGEITVIPELDQITGGHKVIEDLRLPERFCEGKVSLIYHAEKVEVLYDRAALGESVTNLLRSFDPPTHQLAAYSHLRTLLHAAVERQLEVETGRESSFRIIRDNGLPELIDARPLGREPELGVFGMSVFAVFPARTSSGEFDVPDRLPRMVREMMYALSLDRAGRPKFELRSSHDVAPLATFSPQG